MDRKMKETFMELWARYFAGAQLPFTFYYTDRPAAEGVSPPSGHQCVMGVLSRVARGTSLYFDVTTIGCSGGKRFLGFARETMPNFEYFLSYGIPGKLEGERYKKTPEIVRKAVEHFPPFEAPGRFIVFKRWDLIEAEEEPAVVIFFATPDVLSGLFTLANYDEEEPNGVFAPFCAGCASIVQYPYLEGLSERPRAVLGMFDVSARPFVPEGALSFAVPMKKFARMVDNMEESFLIGGSWRKVARRLKG